MSGFSLSVDMTGDWGKSQRLPTDEEHHYHVDIYGGPGKHRSTSRRERHCLETTSPSALILPTKEIRSVGYLKFVRNLDAHAGQAIEAGRLSTTT